MKASTYDKILNLLHNRLGHTSIKKLKHIPSIKPLLHSDTSQICLPCPTSELTKLPFTPSLSYAIKAFKLLQLDIWGPYRVVTRNKYRFFLTLAIST